MLALMMRRQSPLLMRRFDYPKFEGEQLVVVANWLPHRVTLGYSLTGGPGAERGERCGDSESGSILSRRFAIWRMSSLSSPWRTSEWRRWSSTETQLEEATDDILMNNGIPRQGSGELLKVWNEK